MRDCCAGVVLAFRASQAALNSAFAVSRSLAEPMGSPPGRWTLTAQSQTHRTVRFTLVGVVFVHHENAELFVRFHGRLSEQCTFYEQLGRRASAAPLRPRATSVTDPALLLKSDRVGDLPMTRSPRRSAHFPQEQLKRSHCATRLCPCGLRFRRVVAMHEASPSRPLEPFRRARPGAFAAMQPTAPIRHSRSPARFSSASASLCSTAVHCAF